MALMTSGTLTTYLYPQFLFVLFLVGRYWYQLRHAARTLAKNLQTLASANFPDWLWRLQQAYK